MTRRLRIAGTAFGAMLVPACAGLPSDPPTIKPVHPPIPTAAGYRATPGSGNLAAKPRTVDKFAEGRELPLPTPQDQHCAAPDLSARTALTPVEHRSIDTVPGPVDPPRLLLPMPIGGQTLPPPEPVPDAEGVIRSPWPVIKGYGPSPETLTPVRSEIKAFTPISDRAPPLISPVNLPGDPPPVPMETIPAALVPPAVIPPAAPETLPPGVIGSSVHQSHASPAGATGVESPFPAEMASNSAPHSGESPLILAVRAFQQNRPDEAVEYLKAYDATTQQLLLSLMPALVRLSEGRMQDMKPAEMDLILEQLTRAPNMIRARASLVANNVCLCREVHNFAHVEPFPDRHTFRPGDIVYLYLELANFSAVPDPKGGCTITVASSLELRDLAGNLVWHAEPKELPDRVSTPPQDYYRNFRLSVPMVPPGNYLLSVRTIDRPTGREVRKAVEMRIGAR